LVRTRSPLASCLQDGARRRTPSSAGQAAAAACRDRFRNRLHRASIGPSFRAAARKRPLVMSPEPPPEQSRVECYRSLRSVSGARRLKETSPSAEPAARLSRLPTEACALPVWRMTWSPIDSRSHEACGLAQDQRDVPSSGAHNRLRNDENIGGYDGCSDASEPIHKILVPMDGSPPSIAALERALVLA
jgi:hypothetical protein